MRYHERSETFRKYGIRLTDPRHRCDRDCLPGLPGFCLRFPKHYVCAALKRRHTHLYAKAQVGLILGSIGLGVVIFLVAYTLLIAYVYFGGIEEMAEVLYGNMGIDYETLLRNLR